MTMTMLGAVCICELERINRWSFCKMFFYFLFLPYIGFGTMIYVVRSDRQSRISKHVRLKYLLLMPRLMTKQHRTHTQKVSIWARYSWDIISIRRGKTITINDEIGTAHRIYHIFCCIYFLFHFENINFIQSMKQRWIEWPRTTIVDFRFDCITHTQVNQVTQ